jgi:hypothetical protein
LDASKISYNAKDESLDLNFKDSEPHVYVANLQVSFACKGETVEMIGPNLEVAVKDGQEIDTTQLSQRRSLSKGVINLKKWSNSKKSESQPVKNLFDDNLNSYFELPVGNDQNDVCIQFSQCVNLTKVWLWIPKSDFDKTKTKPDTYVGDMKVRMQSNKDVDFKIITKKDPIEYQYFFWYTFELSNVTSQRTFNWLGFKFNSPKLSKYYEMKLFGTDSQKKCPEKTPPKSAILYNRTEFSFVPQTFLNSFN